jgi:PAS domain S-box-containing protein
MLSLFASEAEQNEVRSMQDENSKALALAQQAGKCAAWVMDVEAKEVKWQPGGYEIFGRPFAEFSGRIRPIEMVEEADRPEIWAALQRTLESGEPFVVEYRVRWPDGEMHWQEARGIVDPDCPKLIRGTTFDITERKMAELSVLRIEKLAAVGRIASTIAHEINNPLESITNLLFLALSDPSVADPVRGYLLTAEEELARLANISRLTLSFARPQGAPRNIAPEEILENALCLFRRQFKAKQVEIRLEIETKSAIRIFVDELQRTFTNLIANALDAAKQEGGVLRIRMRDEGPNVCIAIEDNGSGIAPEHASRIFEAFYTTKQGVGTGIGLWVTRELVEKNGGTISFASGDLEDGMKTRFELRFPAASHAKAEGPLAS